MLPVIIAAVHPWGPRNIARAALDLLEGGGWILVAAIVCAALLWKLLDTLSKRQGKA